jgi:hypothetical protein
MALTYIPLYSTTLGSTSNDITFSNIDQTYTDLVCIVTGKGVYTSSTFIALMLRFNGDSGTNYSSQEMFSLDYTADKATQATTTTAAISWLAADTAMDNSISSTKFEIHDYAATNKWKSGIARAATFESNTTFGIQIQNWTWRNTAAITSLTFRNPDSASGFYAGTVFDIYGIKRA